MKTTKVPHCPKPSILFKVRILLLDELDYLVTPNQNLLYSLFDWPHSSKSRLVVCGIANTMDFPERLERRIASRIGNRRTVFKQYSRQTFKSVNKFKLLSRSESVVSKYLKTLRSSFYAKKLPLFPQILGKPYMWGAEPLRFVRSDFYLETERGTSDHRPCAARVCVDLLLPVHMFLPKLSDLQKLLLLALALETKQNILASNYMESVKVLFSF